MKKIMIFIILIVIIMMHNIFSFTKNIMEISKLSDEDNLAINTDGRGYPNPLNSDKGWGGGNNIWEVVDGLRTYNDWSHGLAFCGGKNNWCGESCGWRQTTIDFGKEVIVSKIVVWHHGQEHVPSTFKIQYWNSEKFETIYSTTDGRNFIENLSKKTNKWWENFSIPVETEFKPVTTSRIRYLLNNCDIEHGWIYEIEIYGPKKTQNFSNIKDNNPKPLPGTTNRQ